MQARRLDLSKWQTIEITPDAIRSWERTRRRETNTGLRCGYLLGLDVDVRDGGLVHRLHGSGQRHDRPDAAHADRAGSEDPARISHRGAVHQDQDATASDAGRAARADRMPRRRPAVRRLRHSSRNTAALPLAARIAAGRAVVRTAGDDRGAGPRVRGGGRALATRRGRASRGQG